jgi:hypothetical protein
LAVCNEFKNKVSTAVDYLLQHGTLRLIDAVRNRLSSVAINKGIANWLWRHMLASGNKKDTPVKAGLWASNTLSGHR